ncbi:DUF262 domain-containing protein [Dietzia kunjamensis]|uniref:DUF262 domain-containing protein n=1 Tax=Dietzia kunjamensis TaxID=322509 RepID=UPI0020985C9D|nr:DUF262 domain-containing protein [Dietzia kunjamensis]USX45224.1 DUF262 domain-containing protein [Dietzia kunjamensis]
MAIDRKHGVKRVTIRELLSEELRIPAYQRPYRWKPETATQLLDDLWSEFRGALSGTPDIDGSSHASYVLGAVILHREKGAEALDVVDGQQRLLTLTLLLKLLDAEDPYEVGRETWDHADPAAPITKVWRELASRVSAIDGDRSALATFILDNCVVMRIETDDADEAFRVFDSQNYRGKSLLPHDLLKAYHLREIRRESGLMKVALVEAWEAVPDGDLDRLFSSYLWRIRRWSRGMSAPAFSADHVDEFKGVPAKAAISPMALYHRAAQSVVPVLTAWSPESAASDRDASRTRFQLEAPVQAGRPFFEMVAFMLDEVKALRIEGFDPEWERFVSSTPEYAEQPSKAKFRYVSELYLAALLYYTNKFGTADLGEAKRRLFRWAYSLRTNLIRVQLISVDNHARSTDEDASAFGLLRNAERPEELRRLVVGEIGREDRPTHMRELRTLLERLGA